MINSLIGLNSITVLEPKISKTISVSIKGLNHILFFLSEASNKKKTMYSYKICLGGCWEKKKKAKEKTRGEMV